MKRLSIGKIRGLQQIANPDGILTICAMDHRGSLRSMIDEESPGEVNYEEMVERKLELCSGICFRRDINWGRFGFMCSSQKEVRAPIGLWIDENWEVCGVE